jgi:hypothetical protein
MRNPGSLEGQADFSGVLRVGTITLALQEVDQLVKLNFPSSSNKCPLAATSAMYRCRGLPLASTISAFALVIAP